MMLNQELMNNEVSVISETEGIALTISDETPSANLNISVSGTNDSESKMTIEVTGGTDGLTPHIGENGNWYIGK